MFQLALAPDRFLRLLEEGDANELFAVIDRDRAHLSVWLPWVQRTQEPRDVLEFIRTARERVADGGGLELAIVDAGAIAGTIGLGPIDPLNRSATIGYWLAETAQGKGTMTMAVSALVGHAFNALDLHRIEIRVAPSNDRSRAVPERLGFHKDGVLRQAERHDDRYGDLVVYSMLAHEWPTNAP